MPAVRDDLVIEKGAMLARAFQYLDAETDDTPETIIPLTDYVARLTIRSPDVNGEIVADYLSTDVGSPLTIDGPEGTIEIDWDAVMTANDAPADGCRGWYTLKAWPSGQETQAIRFAEGFVQWSPESSRDDETD